MLFSRAQVFDQVDAPDTAARRGTDSRKFLRGGASGRRPAA